MRRKRGDTIKALQTASAPASASSTALDHPDSNGKCANSEPRRSSFDCRLHDWYLHGEDEDSLQRCYKSELLGLCKARGVDCASGTKNDLIEALLHWRKHALPPGMGSHDDLVSKLSARHHEYLSMPDLKDMSIEEETTEQDSQEHQESSSSSTETIASDAKGKRPKRKLRKATKKSASTSSEDPSSSNQDSSTASQEHPITPSPKRIGAKKAVNFPSDEGSTDSTYGSTELAQIPSIPFDQLHFGRKVGSGGFKDVYRGKFRGQEVAIAEIKLGNDDWEDLENELHVLSQLRHDCILRFIGISKLYNDNKEASETTTKAKKKPTTTSTSTTQQDQHNNIQKFCIITDFCRHGDLSDYMRATPKPSFQKMLTLMYDIAFGCSYLHGRRPAVIHRDLKSLNILIGNDGRAKISDFGLAKVKTRVRLHMHTVVGTPNWQAPEMWTDEPNYTEKVDVYSCGLIFWEILMWSNQYPFGDLSDYQIYEKVGKKGLRPPLNNLKKYPRDILDLIDEMWDADPELRPSMSDVVTRLSEMMR